MLRGSSHLRPARRGRVAAAVCTSLGLLAEVAICSRPSIDKAELRTIDKAQKPVILGAVSSDGSIATAFGQLGQQQAGQANKQQGQVQSRSALMQRIQQMPGASSPTLLASNESLSMFEHFEEDDKSHAFEVTFSEAMYGSPSCPCVGVRGLPGNRTFKTGNNVSTVYPPDAGMYCEAWDDGRYGEDCKAGGMPGQGHAWCAAKWCFVDPCTCGMADKATFFDAKMQYHGRPVYLSYATCGEDTSQQGSKLVEQADFTKQCQMQDVEERCLAQGRDASCVWTGKECIEKSLQDTCKRSDDDVRAFGDHACRCVNVAVEGSNEVELASEFPTSDFTHDDIGGRCESWEAVGVGLTCAGKPEDPPACRSRWCFVDPCTCPLESFPAISDRSLTVRGVPAHFSYAACGSEKPADAQLANSCTSLKDYMSCHENGTAACVWDVDRCIKETILKQCKLANEPGSEVFEEHSRRSSAPPRAKARGFVTAALAVSAAWCSGW